MRNLLLLVDIIVLLGVFILLKTQKTAGFNSNTAKKLIHLAKLCVELLADYALNAGFSQSR